MTLLIPFVNLINCFQSLVVKICFSWCGCPMCQKCRASHRTTQCSATLSNDGSHTSIILPQGAQLFELRLHRRRLFENHAREHGVDWLKRYQDRLGWPRFNSLYLITRFYKTCLWSIASFSMQTTANTNPEFVLCILVEVDERIIREDSVWSPPISSNRNKLGCLTCFLLPLGFLSPWGSKATESETPNSDIIVNHVPHMSGASFSLLWLNVGWHIHFARFLICRRVSIGTF